MTKLKVVFCLPGRTFSNRFLIRWSELILHLTRTQLYDFCISNEYSSFVTFARTKCLGASVTRGAHQKPFNGQLDYDVMVWIDSDIVFTTQQVIELIESTRAHAMVSGLYKMEGGTHYAAVRSWDDSYFLKHASFEFLTDNDVHEFRQQSQGVNVMPCAYAGMGFMAIRRGVIEQLPYPWFHRDVHRIPTGSPDIPEMVDCCSEDVALCRNLIEKGIVPAIAVRLDLRVGHEKTVVL